MRTRMNSQILDLSSHEFTGPKSGPTLGPRIHMNSVFLTGGRGLSEPKPFMNSCEFM